MASLGITRRELLLQGAAGLLVVGCPRGAAPGPHPDFGAPVPGASTLSRVIAGGAGPYARLAYGAGEPHLLRQDLGVSAAPERTRRRASLLYLAQLSDTHVLDAESPARVEYAAAVQLGDSYVAKAAFRPQEALTAFVLDAMARQLRRLRRSELSGAALAFAINTGDATDNQQHNELRWMIDILDGGPVTARSGAARYEGVQRPGTGPAYYHPDDPSGDDFGRRGFPAHPGLLEQAQLGFTAEGLGVPWYAVYGNHDGLLQGNVPAIAALGGLATGPLKLLRIPADADGARAFLAGLFRGDPAALRQLLAWLEGRSPGAVAVVTADPARRPLSRREWLQEHLTTRGAPVGHGFSQANVDADTAYYSFDPTPVVHCVVLDTVNRAGGANGSMDRAQLAWLEADLAAHAGAATLLFCHHSLATLDNPLRGAADKEPRVLGPELEALLLRHRGVVALVDGHSHRNQVLPHRRPEGGGFWEIGTAAHIDWPQQSRLLELFDNRDGTLSLLCTLVDHAAPPDGRGALTPAGLAALSRELAYNDPRWSRAAGSGAPADRNVELVLRAPG